MKLLSILIIAIFAVNLFAADKLEKQFHELPLEARRLTAPLFWNNTEVTVRSPEDQMQQARDKCGYSGFEWKSEVPEDCPFELSKTLTGIYFTGRHSDYKCGDTFYPSWASDGNLYSPWTDGVTDGVRCSSGGNLRNGYKTGHAVMIGDNPLDLTIKNTSPPKRGYAAPYRGRYPCGSTEAMQRRPGRAERCQRAAFFVPVRCQSLHIQHPAPFGDAPRSPL